MTGRLACAAMLACVVGACGNDRAALYREINAMTLEGRTYGDAYGMLTKAGFDCGPYRFNQGVSTQELAQPLAMRCHRHLQHALGCDTSQILTIRGRPQTWRIEGVAPWSGPACY